MELFLLLSIVSQASGVRYVVRPILLIMWTAFQSLILRDNNNNKSEKERVTVVYSCFCLIVERRLKKRT